jgi:hypothetical protein
LAPAVRTLGTEPCGARPPRASRMLSSGSSYGAFVMPDCPSNKKAVDRFSPDS